MPRVHPTPVGLCFSSPTITAKWEGMISGTQLEKIGSCNKTKEGFFFFFKLLLFSINLLGTGIKTCDSHPQDHKFGLTNMTEVVF